MIRSGLFREPSPEPSENTALNPIIEWINQNDESLTRVDFEFVFFNNDEQFTKLAEGLKKNTHVHTLNISDAVLTQNQHNQLIEALKENNSIKELILTPDICENLRGQYMDAVNSEIESHNLS